MAAYVPKKAPSRPPRALKKKVVCENRRASHKLNIESTFEAGMALLGTEVKAMRAGRAHLNEAYVQVVGGQAALVGGYIGEYSHGNQFNHKPDRTRRLLMHRKEIDTLSVQLQQQGYTALPMSMYFNEQGRAKLLVGLGRGKSERDKRDSIKAREADREVERVMRSRNR